MYTKVLPFKKSSLQFILYGWIICGIFLASACSGIPKNVVSPRLQNPSPMEEHIRIHKRLGKTEPPGKKWVLDSVLSKSVVLYLPPKAENMKSLDLLIHFNGASHIPMNAVRYADRPLILAVVHLGSGSSVYESPFKDVEVFNRLLRVIQSKSSIQRINNIYCSAFSAGYGAVRELLKSQMHRIDGLLLLDALHTDYVPKATPLAEGGRLNTEKLAGFLDYAQQAIQGEKKMLMTHSEIFPGTFASLTETTDWLLNRLGIPRKPVLKWGPVGMQQIGEAGKGQFLIISFAGNSAPDHIDHLHGMPHFLEMFLED
ncbi:hypothetical protein [Ulvibacterium sp.]|uniref:hypothetical protein n=1 Tax=Ulvibacterium sp. TaxID=2665914 RepID=UPI003BAC8147